VQSYDRDVAAHGREAGDNGLCSWGSIENLFRIDPCGMLRPVSVKLNDINLGGKDGSG